MNTAANQVFANMQAQLLEPNWPDVTHKILNRENYQAWQRQFVFDALQSQRYGASFCLEFGIRDYRIIFESDWRRIDAIVQNEYLDA